MRNRYNEEFILHNFNITNGFILSKKERRG